MTRTKHLGLLPLAYPVSRTRSETRPYSTSLIWNTTQFPCSVIWFLRHLKVGGISEEGQRRRTRLAKLLAVALRMAARPVDGGRVGRRPDTETTVLVVASL